MCRRRAQLTDLSIVAREDKHLNRWLLRRRRRRLLRRRSTNGRRSSRSTGSTPQHAREHPQSSHRAHSVGVWKLFAWCGWCYGAD